MKQDIVQAVEMYCEKFPAELNTFAHTLQSACFNGSIDGVALSKALQETHRMRGTAHCFGYQRIGKLMKQIESDLLEVTRKTGQERVATITRMEKALSALQRFQKRMTPENSKLRTGQSVDEASLLFSADELELLKAQRILFCDDDAMLRILVADIFATFNIDNYELAISGHDVVEKAVEFKPTMIVCDWQMQPVDGLELLQMVRGNKTTIPSDTPFIFLTVSRNTHNFKNAFRDDTDVFLSKPFTAKSLLSAVLKARGRATA